MKMLETTRGALRLLVLLVACGCSGSETGNPTRGHSGGGCSPAEVVFEVVSADGASLEHVSVDGDAAPCEVDASDVRCTLPNPTAADAANQVLTIAADGHEPKEIELAFGQLACGEDENVVHVELEPLATR
jgi:hypothetical protein